MSESIDRINRKTMTTASVVTHYARPWDLSKAEQATFERVAAQAKDQPILYIGVGGGRTRPLTRLARKDRVQRLLCRIGIHRRQNGGKALRKYYVVSK